MNLSTDLAKVCARESSAIPAAIKELSDRLANIAGDNSSITLAVSRYDEEICVRFHAWQGANTFNADNLDEAIDGINKFPQTEAAKKRAEAAKLLDEAAKLDGVGSHELEQVRVEKNRNNK